MKIRNGFVSNSSSSSFICITPNKGEAIYDAGYEPDFETETTCFDIDTLIAQLLEAKEAGATIITVEYGGGYDG